MFPSREGNASSWREVAASFDDGRCTNLHPEAKGTNGFDSRGMAHLVTIFNNMWQTGFEIPEIILLNSKLKESFWYIRVANRQLSQRYFDGKIKNITCCYLLKWYSKEKWGTWVILECHFLQKTSKLQNLHWTSTLCQVQWQGIGEITIHSFKCVVNF